MQWQQKWSLKPALQQDQPSRFLSFFLRIVKKIACARLGAVRKWAITNLRPVVGVSQLWAGSLSRRRGPFMLEETRFSSSIPEGNHGRPPTRSKVVFAVQVQPGGRAGLTLPAKARWRASLGLSAVLNSPPRLAGLESDFPIASSPQVLSTSPQIFSSPPARRSAAISVSQGIDSAPCSDPSLMIVACYPIRFDCESAV